MLQIGTLIMNVQEQHYNLAFVEMSQEVKISKLENESTRSQRKVSRRQQQREEKHYKEVREQLEVYSERMINEAGNLVLQQLKTYQESLTVGHYHALKVEFDQRFQVIKKIKTHENQSFLREQKNIDFYNQIRSFVHRWKDSCGKVDKLEQNMNSFLSKINQDTQYFNILLEPHQQILYNLKEQLSVFKYNIDRQLESLSESIEEIGKKNSLSKMSNKSKMSQLLDSGFRKKKEQIPSQELECIDSDRSTANNSSNRNIGSGISEEQENELLQIDYARHPFDQSGDLSRGELCQLNGSQIQPESSTDSIVIVGEQVHDP